MNRGTSLRRFAAVALISACAMSSAWAQVQRPVGGPGRRPGFTPAGGVPGAQTNTPGTTTNGQTGSARGFLPPGIELVAGVRLDKPAEMPPGLNDIRAVAYDAAKKQFVLVGQHNTKLPGFRPEDLAVALRSVGQGFPAVSIEGPMQDGQMTVKYYGGIEKTRFGQVLFEADRMLKSLALGRDNVTKQFLRPGVRGYESEVRKLQRMGGAQRPKAWHRYWFRPALVSMTLSDDGQALRFDDVNIEVKTEYVPAVAEGESEPAAEEFAQHFTEHFDDFARVYPVFAELRELAKVTALAQWMHESGIPTDSLGLEKAVVPEVETAQTTPIGFAQMMELLPEGLMKHQMEGGVSLRLWSETAAGEDGAAPAQRGNWLLQRQGNARDLLKTVMKKATPEAAQWLSTYTPAVVPVPEKAAAPPAP